MFLQNELDQQDIALARRYEEDRQNAAEKRERMLAEAQILDPLLSELNEIFGDRISLSVNRTDIDVRFSGDKEFFLSVLRVICKHGFRLPENRPEAGQPEWCGFLRHSECRVPIWVAFTSTVCRRVQIGTKTVEEPVYEIRCDESENPV